MKKFLLLCIGALFCCALSWADNEVLCLTLATTDGDEIYFGLDDDPVITYGDKTITVESEPYSVVDMSIYDLEMYYFADAIPTGIGAVPTMDGSSTEFSNGKVLVRGLNVGSQVAVYTADGQMVGSVTASEDGNVCVDLNSLKGNQVYILRTPSASFKIVK